MADLFVAPVPECPVHGPMKARTGDAGGYTGTAWACPGWDGEGCDYQAPPRDWQRIGWTVDVPFTMEYGPPYQKPSRPGGER